MYGLLRLTLDTNILISALMTTGTPPDLIYKAWKEGVFTLVTSNEQISELERVLAYPKLKPYIRRQEAETLVAGIGSCADIVRNLDTVYHSPDPADNVIIATALKGQCHFLVTGDKKDLLFLKRVESVSIITARIALEILKEPVLDDFIR
jgi:putative PIN family toxin of toxin-antitoxin system